MRPKRYLLTSLLPLALSLAASCGGGGGAPPEEPAAPAPEPTVEETLHKLGVDTTETPRVDHAGDPLPASYSPLGTTYELEKLSELLVLGMAAEDSTDPISVHDLEVDITEPDAPPELLHAISEAEAPWAEDAIENDLPPVSQRAAAAADVDGDGREELAFVYFAENRLHLVLVEDGEAEFGRTESVLIEEWTEFLDVTLAAGDVDGDGEDELVLGYSVPFKAVVAIVDEVEGALAIDESTARTFSTQFHDSVLLVDCEVGNLDYDGAEELALVLNEYGSPDVAPSLETLGSTWLVLDDAATGLAELASGVLEAEDGLGTTRTALVADVAVGDLDADGIDEVALGGLWLPGEWCIGHYVMAAFDDAVHGLEPLGSAVLSDEVGDEPNGDSGCEVQVRWAHVGIADLEGEHAGEIHVNELIFWDLKAQPAWTLRAEIPDWFTRGAQQSTTMSAMAVADFTGDARQDIAVLAQGRDVAVWGIAPEDPDQELAKLRALPMEHVTLVHGYNPVLVPVNPDSDATILEFVEHRWLMTEPVVMAVLASPPAAEGIGQNVDACTTEYGESTGSSTGSENEVNVNIAFLLGGEFKAWGNGVEFEAKWKGDYTHTWTSNYTVTTSISYETGPLEDTVICLVAPYDHYTYRVLSDPDPEHVGDLVDISIPREPISLQVERSFYNDAVASDAVKIDDSVLSHQVGVRSSYLSVAEKDELLVEWPGMETGPAAVGQGAGSTTLGIAVTEEEGSSDYLGYSFEFEAKTLVAGLKLGIVLGNGYGHTWTRSVSEETVYSGTVGSIDAAHFADEHYSFGLFVYTQYAAQPDRAFDVVNYWVE